MAVLVSLGGLIFGYGGIGQIGGFLAMQNYRDSFGDVTKDVSGTFMIRGYSRFILYRARGNFRIRGREL